VSVIFAPALGPQASGPDESTAEPNRGQGPKTAGEEFQPMYTVVARRATAGLIATVAAFVLLVAAAPRAQANDTVTIRGNAYAFIFAGNLSRLEGAKIGIAEYPELTTTAGPNGAYALEVPDDTTLTPYAEMDGYYPTHHQTFHTRGYDLNQVNFQMPAMNTYFLLAGVVEAQQVQGGKLARCGIVSTFFQKEGRSFLDFDDFHDFRPHGVEESTATATPGAGRQYYFNDSVYPDPLQQFSSRDGGVLWVDVESGVYEIKGQNLNTRHASFVATCEPGRLVNANPPWGLYELAGNEETNPATLPADPDLKLEAAMRSSRVVRQGPRRRILKVAIRADENVTARVTLRQGKRQVRRSRKVAAGNRVMNFALGSGVRGGAARLSLVLTDEAGNSDSSGATLFVPPQKRR
jgi:hypothetical protein